MRAGAVPVAGHRLRVEGDDDAEVLGDAVQQVARHPQHVAHLDAFTRTHLVLPLQAHTGAMMHALRFERLLGRLNVYWGG